MEQCGADYHETPVGIQPHSSHLKTTQLLTRTSDNCETIQYACKTKCVQLRIIHNITINERVPDKMLYP